MAAPSPLHSYLLCATRSENGTDAITTIHRVGLSCPGENWCHRGGCPDTAFDEAAALLTPIIAEADAAHLVHARPGWAGETYGQL